MATSGSIDFVVNRDAIITESLEQMGVLAEGQSPSTDQLTSMGRTLNMLVKTWQADKLNLFAIQKVYVYLEKDKSAYNLSSTTTDNFSKEYNRTSMKVAGVSTDLTIDVNSITGATNGDYIGIKLDDGTMQWTTINGVPSGDTITISTALTGATGINNTVYFYTLKANRPMKIMNVLLSDSVSNSDIPIWLVSRDEYTTLPNKKNDGAVNQVWYDPQIGTGVLSVWPQSDSVDKYLTLYVQRTLEDFDAATDDADFPQEWYLPLAFNLAAVSCSKYGVPRVERSHILSMASYYYEMAQSFDIEEGFQFQPERMG